MTREERIKVWKDTVDAVNDGSYESESGEVIEFTKQDEMKAESVFYAAKCKCGNVTVEASAKKAEVSVINDDCLKVAERLTEEGLETCVLNMASFLRPGGGVMSGSAAQEEDIFRRTNIFKSLFQYSILAADYGVEENEQQYPLERTYGAIYTPHVTVFRGSSAEGYKYLDKPFMVNVVSVAAVKRPQIVGNRDIQDWVKNTIGRKVMQMLDIAICHGNDAIVLGAFGCGAYATPPEPVAKIFKAVLEMDRYAKAFDKVVFAVLDDANSHKAHNPEGNYKPFKEILESNTERNNYAQIF